MIVEWVGCSGAGKSTLREETHKLLLSSGVDVRKPLEIFLGKTTAKLIQNEKLRNLVLDFLVLPWSILSTAKHRHFFKFCTKILRRDYPSIKQRIFLLRSILRKMGLYVFLNCFPNDKQLILVDEGTVHIAHILFGNSSKKDISRNDIEEFCDLVPVPELVIHIMAPKTEIINRTLSRRDKPINELSPEALKQFIELGFEIFHIINQLNPWDKKNITFLNEDKELGNIKENALIITNQIMDIFPTLKK